MCPNKHCHKNKLHRSHQASCEHSIFPFAQNRLLLTHLLLPHIHHEIALLFVAEPPQNAQLHQIRHHRGFPPIFPLDPVQHFPRKTLPGSFTHQMMQRRKNRGRSGIERSCESKRNVETNVEMDRRRRALRRREIRFRRIIRSTK